MPRKRKRNLQWNKAIFARSASSSTTDNGSTDATISVTNQIRCPFCNEYFANSTAFGNHNRWNMGGCSSTALSLTHSQGEKSNNDNNTPICSTNEESNKNGNDTVNSADDSSIDLRGVPHSPDIEDHVPSSPTNIDRCTDSHPTNNDNGDDDDDQAFETWIPDLFHDSCSSNDSPRPELIYQDDFSLNDEHSDGDSQEQTDICLDDENESSPDQEQIITFDDDTDSQPDISASNVEDYDGDHNPSVTETDAALPVTQETVTTSGSDLQPQEHRPPLLPDEVASVELLSILQAANAPLSLHDTICKWANHSSHIHSSGKQLPQCIATIAALKRRYQLDNMSPKEVDCYLPGIGTKIKLTTHDFESSLQSLHE